MQGKRNAGRAGFAAISISFIGKVEKNMATKKAAKKAPAKKKAAAKKKAPAKKR